MEWRNGHGPWRHWSSACYKQRWTGGGTNGTSPVLWSGGTVMDLGGIGQALAINDAGNIVGQAVLQNSYGYTYGAATLWSGGSTFQLNNYLTSSGIGWQLYEATGINDVGQIVGFGLSPLG